MKTFQKKSRATEGLKTFCNEGSLDIVSDARSPVEQLEQLESLLELPEGERVGLDGVEALRRFFEVIASDVRGKRGPRVILRRILGTAHRCGALRQFALGELGVAAKCTRQNLHRSATAVEERLGTTFPREKKGPGHGKQKNDG